MLYAVKILVFEQQRNYVHLAKFCMEKLTGLSKLSCDRHISLINAVIVFGIACSHSEVLLKFNVPTLNYYSSFNNQACITFNP